MFILFWQKVPLKINKIHSPNNLNSQLQQFYLSDKPYVRPTPIPLPPITSPTLKPCNPPPPPRQSPSIKMNDQKARPENFRAHARLGRNLMTGRRGGGSRPDHNFRPKKHHFLFLLPFDAEAFKTCDVTGSSPSA